MEIVCKDNCNYIFRDFNKNEENTIPINTQDWVSIKFKKYGIISTLRKLRNLVASKELTGIHYIVCWIKIY